MKALLFNCKEVAWGSPCLKNNQRKVTNPILVFLCCEKNDTRKKLKETVRRINQLNRKRFQKTNLAIFPFAHLSNNILEQDKALLFVKDAADSLEKRFSVDVLPFNSNKEVLINLLEKNEDVSFISY